jgi:hypothetical protein
MNTRISIALSVATGVGLIILVLGATGAWLIPPCPALAILNARYVATTGSDAANSCTNAAAPCATIQHAVDVANSGDVIRVAGGTYRRAGTVAAVTKTLAIEGGYSDDFSAHDPETYLTVLDAQRQGSVVSATNVSDLWLHHLILRGGDGTGNCLNGCGGGIYARNTHLAAPSLSRRPSSGIRLATRSEPLSRTRISTHFTGRCSVRLLSTSARRSPG